MQDIHKNNLKFKYVKSKFWKRVLPVVGIGALIIFGISYGLYVKKTIESANNGSGEKVNFTVKAGESLDQISKNLEDAKIIKSDFIFSLYIKASKRSGSIQAGEYQIAGNLNMKEVAGIITAGQVFSNRITIPEGWTLDKMAARVASQGIATKGEFLTAAKYQKSRDGKFLSLADLKEGDSLEGFLYPDTYELSKKANANELITKMLTNFDQKLTPEIRAKIKTSGMNTYEVVTLASMVEREAVKESDRKLVAGVFERRLNLGMPLQSDVTVLYALKQDKKSVTWEDTKVDSPYNTYKVVGLPAGPICAPSIQSINAVISPTKSDYLYFLAAPNGTVYYSTTVEQHNVYKEKYLR